MEKITRSLLTSNIITLFIFGIVYSMLLSPYLGAYTGFIFIMMTVGFVTTIYIAAQKSGYGLVTYVWISIIIIAEIVLIMLFIIR